MAFQLFRTAEKTFSGRKRLFFYCCDLCRGYYLPQTSVPVKYPPPQRHQCSTESFRICA